MKAEHINPFITGMRDIFQEVAQIPLELNGTTLRTTPTASKNVVIMLGMTGNLRGSIAISLDEALAKEIASTMMCGMPVLELDELSKSAISELSNMMMGRVCTAFSTQQLFVDITPPSLMVGQNIQLTFSQLPVISIRFQYKSYEIHLDISVKES